jgi:hypothetical protein
MDIIKRIGGYLAAVIGTALLTIGAGVSDSVQEFLLLPVRCMQVAEKAQMQAEQAYVLASKAEDKVSAGNAYTDILDKLDALARTTSAISANQELLQMQQYQIAGYLRGLSGRPLDMSKRRDTVVSFVYGE